MERLEPLYSESNQKLSRYSSDLEEIGENRDILRKRDSWIRTAQYLPLIIALLIHLLILTPTPAPPHGTHQKSSSP